MSAGSIEQAVREAHRAFLAGEPILPVAERWDLDEQTLQHEYERSALREEWEVHEAEARAYGDPPLTQVHRRYLAAFDLWLRYPDSDLVNAFYMDRLERITSQVMWQRRLQEQGLMCHNGHEYSKTGGRRVNARTPPGGRCRACERESQARTVARKRLAAQLAA